MQVRVSALDKLEIDWAKHEIEPHWIGSETSECVAALQPARLFTRDGARERDRFLAGAAGRDETALVISVLGYADDVVSGSGMRSGGGDSVDFAPTMTVVHGDRLPDRTKVRLAAELPPADEDLGKRLLSRPPTAPWWSLSLHALAGEGSGGVTTYTVEGELQPILLGPLGEPVVAVWVSPDEQIRWYIISDDINWNTILDWLVHRAIPAYVPTAARRYRSTTFVDTDLLTPAEEAAKQALADMEIRHVEERQRLQADLDQARQDATPIRDGLFYGAGDELVNAVATVLDAAGFEVVDLDTELGATISADLLVTLDDYHRRLVEVKSAGRNASESLVDDLLRHLRTWPELRPELPVGGGALVVNHQLRRPPNERTRAAYTRQAFVDSLPVPVIAVHDLFDWWRTSNWPAVQRAILGTSPPTPTGVPYHPEHTPDQPPNADNPSRRSGWGWRRR